VPVTRSISSRRLLELAFPESAQPALPEPSLPERKHDGAPGESGGHDGRHAEHRGRRQGEGQDKAAGQPCGVEPLGRVPGPVRSVNAAAFVTA
jgi:hypothetical protein